MRTKVFGPLPNADHRSFAGDKMTKFGLLDEGYNSMAPAHEYRRMPAHFGPSFGPRNWPVGMEFDHAAFPLSSRFAIHFRTDAAMLQAMLPKGLSLAGEPIATVEFVELRHIQWLAGRNYNTLSFSYPVIFHGRDGDVTALFRSVIFESLPDAVITGREELGTSKLWADLPDPVRQDDRISYRAAWGGFEFAQLSIAHLEEHEQPLVIPGYPQTSGIINYKYMPRTGKLNEADVSCFTFWEHYSDSGMTVDKVYIGDADFAFRTSRWEDLPTLCTVVNRLADLPVNEIVLAELVEARGQGTIGNARIIY
jgi:hypothetical protein